MHDAVEWASSLQMSTKGLGWGKGTRSTCYSLANRANLESLPGGVQEHDVAGAARAGIQSLFIGGGIHLKELSISLASNGDISTDDLDELCSQFKCSAPTYAMSFLR